MSQSVECCSHSGIAIQVQGSCSLLSLSAGKKNKSKRTVTRQAASQALELEAMCIQANTAASLFAWLQCHDCPLHLFKALGGGRARPSGSHILLNVALTGAFPFEFKEVAVFILYLLANNHNKCSVTRQAAS